jgi:hypothetical protein
MSCPRVILSLSKDGRAIMMPAPATMPAESGLCAMPILRQAQDDTVAARRLRDAVAGA